VSDKGIYTERVVRLVRGCYDQFSDVPWLSVSEFLRRKEREAWTLVDSRPRHERTVSVIPGSVSREAFEAEIGAYRGGPLLVYCTIGCRSGAYARALRGRGLDAYNLWGGVLAWALAGQGFVTPGGQPTRAVHIHGKPRSVLPPGYRPVGWGWHKR
jgi:rhodanese-related sulfurtransferase